jgi:hypothetical protein
MRFVVRALPSVTLAVAMIGLTAPTSRADIVSSFANARSSLAGAPRQVLPALSNPRPIRQAVVVECNATHPKFGSNICLISFDKVPTASVLQIEKLSCFGTASGAMLIFNNQLKIEAAFVMGLVLPPYLNAGVGQSSGPYYFNAGDTPRLAGTASGPTAQAFCSMFGTLWDSN